MEVQEKICQIALSQIQGMGYTRLQRLMTRFGSAQAICQSTPRTLTNIPGVGKRLSQAICQGDILSKAAALWEKHHKANTRIITPWEAAYPERLKHIYAPPTLLYLRGNVDLNATKVISIVGTRRATNYGKKAVETLLSGLHAFHPLLVVSGLAYGIDIHAHRTALTLGLPTLGVLAGGVDVIYPSTHKDEATSILVQGGLLSEHPLQTPPAAYRFVTRNRIIAGVADAVIVVEADQKSGALITASFANEYSREVFALPGDIYTTYSIGCHYLIKTHQAHLLTSAEDLIEAMYWDQVTPASEPLLDRLTNTLTEIEKEIVRAIGALEVHVDTLSDQTKIPLHQLSAILLQLELKKIIKFLPGKRYRLVSTTYAQHHITSHSS